MADGKIHVSNADSQEACVFDKLHLDSFTLKHNRSPLETPIQLTGLGTKYGVDSAGKKCFSPKVFRPRSNNLDQDVIATWMVAKEKTLDEARAAISAARVDLATKYATGVIDDMYLYAAFEMAIARIVEITTDVDIAGI